MRQHTCLTCSEAVACAGAMTDESAFGMSGLEGIVDIQFHPDDTQHMLFHGLGFHHWITEDSGKTFKVDLAAASAASACCQRPLLRQHSCHKQLLLTDMTIPVQT